MNLINLISVPYPNSLKTTKVLLSIWLIAISFTSAAQDDFESKENRKLIKDFKIKEIKSYLYPEEGKPGDSMLVNHSSFNADGLCIKEITTDYTNTFEYNAAGLKTKETSEQEGKTGQSIIVFNYDSRGNMILSERIQEGWKEPLNYIYYKHRLSYDAENRLVKDEWIDKSGKAQIILRQEYLAPQPDSGVLEMIKYYDMNDHPYRLEKKYNDGQVVMYNLGDQQNSIRYELFVDKNKRIVKIVDNWHMGPHALDMIKEYGHGGIKISKVTELYSYNSFGLIAEKLTYQDGVVIEKQTWHYIL